MMTKTLRCRDHVWRLVLLVPPLRTSASLFTVSDGRQLAKRSPAPNRFKEGLLLNLSHVDNRAAVGRTKGEGQGWIILRTLDYY
jgi:hypothetical protein